MIKAIETVYNDYRFRSRLEARWAVFFDEMGIAYLYESEGFDLNGTWYLPDFWLPGFGIWIEIKPPPPREEHMDLARLFAHRMCVGPILFLWGDPRHYQSMMFCWDSTDSGTGAFQDVFGLFCNADETREPYLLVSDSAGNKSFYADPCCSQHLSRLATKGDIGRLSVVQNHPRWLHAVQVACQSRF